jgi:AcrR family transcriptional regulator
MAAPPNKPIRRPKRQGDSLELLWGDRAKSTRGPRPSSSLDEIVELAIAIADSEGVDAVSMPQVAKRLGMTTMSLYRYVRSKDELVDVMLDTAIGLPPQLGRITTWRRRTERWARAEWEVFLRHPWILRLVPHRSALGPNRIAWLDAGLLALAPADLEAPEAFAVFQLVDGFVRGAAQDAVAFREAGERGGEGWWEAALTRGMADDRYPNVGRIMSSSAEPLDPLEFGLARLLDGVEAMIQSRPEPPSRRVGRGRKQE